MSFAAGTTVPVERSRAEIEKLLSQHGATKFMSGWAETAAVIGFMAHGRMVRFKLPLPARGEAKAVLLKRRGCPRGGPRQESIDRWINDETRRRWRCLLLAIKAKLEVVETGIETFESAFLAQIVLPDNETVYDKTAPLVEHAYQTGEVGRLLLGPGGSP